MGETVVYPILELRVAIL